MPSLRMKQAPIVMLLVLLGGVSFLAMPAVVAQGPAAEQPEFYFTRLMYEQNGYYGFGGTMRNPGPYKCPEFGGGNFFPPQGNGWLTDSPGADCKLMGAIHRMTGQSVYSNPNYMEIMNPDLFKYPVAYIIEVSWWTLTDREAAALRAYIQKGGFVIVDDFKMPGDFGSPGWEPFETNMKRVLPAVRFYDLDASHPIFHAFFEIDDLSIVPQAYNYGRPIFRGVFEDNDPGKRLQMIVNYNTDVSQFWEWSGTGLRPIDQTNEAYKLGVNYLVYGMTH